MFIITLLILGSIKKSALFLLLLIFQNNLRKNIISTLSIIITASPGGSVLLDSVCSRFAEGVHVCGPSGGVLLCSFTRLWPFAVFGGGWSLAPATCGGRSFSSLMEEFVQDRFSFLNVARTHQGGDLVQLFPLKRRVFYYKWVQDYCLFIYLFICF